AEGRCCTSRNPTTPGQIPKTGSHPAPGGRLTPRRPSCRRRGQNHTIPVEIALHVLRSHFGHTRKGVSYSAGINGAACFPYKSRMTTPYFRNQDSKLSPASVHSATENSWLNNLPVSGS